MRDTKNDRPCRSYNDDGGRVCKDGFVQTFYCRGVVGCPHCGEFNPKPQYLPACLKDDGIGLTEDGLPKFYPRP